MIKITLPLSKEDIAKLKVGDRVLLSGRVLTARDAAHKRFFDLLEDNKPLPVDIKGQGIFYVGACFDACGKVISAGPTTSLRMTKYAPKMFDEGLSFVIGKGKLDESVVAAIKNNGGLYFIAIGGAGALYARKIKKQELLCYGDLKAEGVYAFEIEDFPLIVGAK